MGQAWLDRFCNIHDTPDLRTALSGYLSWRKPWSPNSIKQCYKFGSTTENGDLFVPHYVIRFSSIVGCASKPEPRFLLFCFFNERGGERKISSIFFLKFPEPLYEAYVSLTNARYNIKSRGQFFRVACSTKEIAG